MLLLLVNFGFLLCPVWAQTGTVTVDVSTNLEVIAGQEYYLHEVKRGETLYSISRAYNVAVEAILQANPELQDGLRFDQVIKIPVIEEIEPPRQLTVHAPEPEGEYFEHKVRRRETLFGLSQKYNVPIEVILYYNPAARGGLKVDQVLRIPAPEDKKALPPESEMYEQAYLHDSDSVMIYNVIQGDTKYGISRRMGISIEMLEDMNPEIKDGLRVGQQVRIPVIFESHTQTLPAPVAPETETLITIRPDTQDRHQDFLEADCFEPALKDVYNVAVLLPFYLEELLPGYDSLALDNAGLPYDPIDLDIRPDMNLADNWKDYWDDGLSTDHKSFTFITYYQGILLALDSIKQQGVNIQLHVYDVCNNVKKATKIISDEGFEDMDLIIGPFHRQTLEIIASFGHNNNIPVVSPLLPDRHQLEGFPNVFKVQTPIETMLNGVAKYISQNYPRQNILIVHNQQPGAARLISALRDTLIYEVAKMNYFYDSLNLSRVNGYFLNGALVGSRQTNLLVMPDTVSVMFPVKSLSNQKIQVPKPYNVKEVVYRDVGMEGLKKQLRIERENVLVTLISGEPFLSDYLRQLHKLRHDYDISVFGIPEWQNYSSIEFDYLQNLKVHIFVPFFYDYGDPHIQDFVYRYRKTFQTEPDNEALKAVQTAYFFFEALAAYGNDFFQCMPYLNHSGFESPFSFGRPFGETHGWENQHFSIYRIKNYRPVDVQKPVDFDISQQQGLN